MSYRKVNFHQSEKEIIREVTGSDKPLLLIPPDYEGRNPIISHPPRGEKYIGLFSSGSTGRPGCIWNTYQNLIENANRSAAAFEINPKDRLLILAKPWHVAGLTWAMMAEELGCEYAFVTTNRGEGDKWLKAITDFKPDVLLTGPKVLHALYGKEWQTQKIIFGGTPFPEEDTGPLSAHAAILMQGYGMTEAGGLISAHKHLAKDEWAEKEHQCCGLPVEGVEIRCEGSSENPAEIMIKSATAGLQGWYGSRDLGFLDSEGRIYLAGRKLELTNSDKF